MTGELRGYHDTRSQAGVCVREQSVRQTVSGDWYLHNNYQTQTSPEQIRSQLQIIHNFHAGGITRLGVSDSCRDLPPVISLSISLVLKTPGWFLMAGWTL